MATRSENRILSSWPADLFVTFLSGRKFDVARKTDPDSRMEQPHSTRLNAEPAPRVVRSTSTAGLCFRNAKWWQLFVIAYRATACRICGMLPWRRAKAYQGSCHGSE